MSGKEIIQGDLDKFSEAVNQDPYVKVMSEQLSLMKKEKADILDILSLERQLENQKRFVETVLTSENISKEVQHEIERRKLLNEKLEQLGDSRDIEDILHILGLKDSEGKEFFPSLKLLSYETKQSLIQYFKKVLEEIPKIQENKEFLEESKSSLLYRQEDVNLFDSSTFHRVIPLEKRLQLQISQPDDVATMISMDLLGLIPAGYFKTLILKLFRVQTRTESGQYEDDFDKETKNLQELLGHFKKIEY